MTISISINRPWVIGCISFRSMYFDEDGDLAHEFYEEIVSSSTPRSRRKGKLRCRKMKKVNAKHLRPQGDVDYPHPRLHVDCPVILHQG